jgi:hypothetical protein
VVLDLIRAVAFQVYGMQYLPVVYNRTVPFPVKHCFFIPVSFNAAGLLHKKNHFVAGAILRKKCFSTNRYFNLGMGF